jgi:hypothetical protein
VLLHASSCFTISKKQGDIIFSSLSIQKRFARFFMLRDIEEADVNSSRHFVNLKKSFPAMKK